MSVARVRPTRLLLGRRMTLTVAGIATILAAGYMVAGIWFANISLEREFEQNADLTTASLASSLIEAMLTSEFHKIPDLLDNSAKANPNIVYSFVTDIDGNPVAHTRAFASGIPGDLLRLAQEHVKNKGGHGAYVLRTEAGDVYHLVYPLTGKPGGYLHLGFSFKPVDVKLRSAARHLIASMLAGLLLSTLGAGLVYRRMAQPLLALTSAAADLGEGDLTRRVHYEGRRDDEVSLLAQSFNHMADRLQGQLTELLSSRNELADEQARVQAILDGMMHGVIFYNPEGVVSYLNAAAKRHWGLSELAARESYEFLHAQEPEVVQALECAAMDKNLSRRRQVRRGDRILELFVRALHRPGRGFLGIMEISADVTEQEASTRALAHAEKLNVVGQLAAGMAHEINSPLDGALEAAKMFENENLPRDEFRKFARAQKTALERIAAIINRLLTFSRREQAAVGSAALGPALSEAVELIAYRLKNAGLRLLAPDPSGLSQIVMGESFELSQVFVNLLSNAIDASPAQGEIKLEVNAGESQVEVSVVDQGPGIPEEAETRIFTPFFTTKEVGKGTGLGLAISKNIVEQIGGAIHFNNEEPPWGARFTVRIPRAEVSPDEPQKGVVS